MSTTSNDQHQELRQHIHDSLRKASAHRDRLKRVSTRYSVINIVLGSLATLVAGVSAVQAAPVTGSWVSTCGIASLFAFGGTVVMGLQKQLADPDLLNEASECVGRLRALRVDTVPPTYDVEVVRQKYQQVLSDFSRIDL